MHHPTALYKAVKRGDAMRSDDCSLLAQIQTNRQNSERLYALLQLEATRC